MAEGKKGFILYTDLTSTVKKLILKDRERKTNNAGELFYHILQYVSDENPEPVNDTIDIVFEQIKMQLKRDLEKWEKRSERSRNNGLKGGRPPKNDNHNEPTITQKTQQVILEPKKPDNVIMCNNVLSDNVNDNVNDNVILLKKETKDNLGEISNFEEIEVLETGEIKKEKSSAKKEKENKPDLSEFLEYAEQIIAENNLGSLNEYKLAIDAKYEQWSNNDWKDGHGKPIKRWKPKLKIAFQYFKPIKQNGYGNGQQQQKQQPVIGRMSEETLKRNIQGW